MNKLTKAEELTKQTYDKLAQEWQSTHSNKSFWSHELQRFHNYLPRGRLLDVGCGAGRDAYELTKFGYEYSGVDFSRGLIEQARKRNPGIKFSEGSIYDLDFQEPFDGFWCAAVLLHIPKNRVTEALRAIIKNIKPGAVGFISVKQGGGEHIEARGGVKGYDRLISYWQADDFRKVLIHEGFEVIEEGAKPYETSVWLTFIVRA